MPFGAKMNTSNLSRWDFLRLVRTIIPWACALPGPTRQPGMHPGNQTGWLTLPLPRLTLRPAGPGREWPGHRNLKSSSDLDPAAGRVHMHQIDAIIH